MSPPAWGRGLKLADKALSGVDSQVAPRVGAWIETLSNNSDYKSQIGRPPRGAWIETHS